MLRRMSLTQLFIVALVTFVATSVQAQSLTDPLKACETKTKEISLWAKCITDTVVTIATQQANQRHPAKQVELPSIAENTTSLVDQTSAPDLAGLALNFAGIKSDNDSNDNAASGTITTSAYALYAAATQNDPLDPAFYNSHPDLRRFSFTFGRDGGDSNLPTKGTATVLGFKALIMNGREVTKNRAKLDAISDALIDADKVFARIQQHLEDYLFSQFRDTLGSCNSSTISDFVTTCVKGESLTTMVAMLTPKQRAEIAEVIAKEATTENPNSSPLIKFKQTTTEVIGKIRRAPQLSFTFQSKLRNAIGDDEYRTGLLFDYGVWDRFNLSLNGTFDYDDSKLIGGDTRAGRFAAEGIFQLTPNKSSFGDPRPYLLSPSFEAKWANNNKSTYVGQLKLTIPIPGMTGVNFPISVSFANRSDLIKEKEVRGRFGFTVDISKLLSKTP